MIRDEYIRDAVVDRVVDGDTLDLMVDLGFGTFKKIRVRLLGIDCPEIRGKEKVAGRAAREFVTRLRIQTPSRVSVKTTKYKKGKYGRYLAEVYSRYADCEDEQSWNSKIIESGHGVSTEK